MSWDAKKSGKGRGSLLSHRGEPGAKKAKQYVGKGVIGARAARQDAEVRRQREGRQRNWDLAWAQIEECRRPLDEFCCLVNMVVKSVLVVGGLYQHGGSEWRRRGAKNA